jgi:hypothetical protein
MIEINRRSPEDSLEPVLELSFELRRGEPIPRLFVIRRKDGVVEWMGDDYSYGQGAMAKKDQMPRVKYRNL